MRVVRITQFLNLIARYTCIQKSGFTPEAQR